MYQFVYHDKANYRQNDCPNRNNIVCVGLCNENNTCSNPCYQQKDYRQCRLRFLVIQTKVANFLKSNVFITHKILPVKFSFVFLSSVSRKMSLAEYIFYLVNLKREDKLFFDSFIYILTFYCFRL